MRTRLGLVFASVLAISASAAPSRDFVSDHLAGAHVKIHGSGDFTTLKILFLGDGFTADDASMGAYRAAVDDMAAQLLATEPFQTLSDTLTLYRMDVISDQAGIDVPEKCPEGSSDPNASYDHAPALLEASRFQKTPLNALDTHWCAASSVWGGVPTKWLLDTDTSTDHHVADFVAKFIEDSGLTPDITVVVLNDYWMGASAYQYGDLLFITTGRNDLLHEKIPGTEVEHINLPDHHMARVFVHELGHMDPFLLLDEYSTGRDQAQLPGEQAFIDQSPNLSTVIQPAKWVPLGATNEVTDCTSVNPPAVGAELAGHGFALGVYHSACDCRMDEAGQNIPFCVVCRDQIYRALPWRVVNVPEVPHTPPPPLWVVLDSMWITSGVSGKYSLEYAIAAGGETITGVWPHGTGASMERGRVIQPGALLAVLPPGTSGQITLGYSLYRLGALGERDNSRTLIASESSIGKLIALTPGLYPVSRPAFKMMIAVVQAR